MLKAGLRFPLSALHRRLLQYLGLTVTQISPNAWRVFLGVEVLYGAMSDGARRLMVEEFFHCYYPAKIAQSKGMYSFLPRSLLLRLICETPDSNRDWKSRYFFMEGDEWMCHPGDHEYMPVNKTWGIMPPSGMHSSIIRFSIVLNFLHVILTIHLLLQLGIVHKFRLNSGAFWKRFSTKLNYLRGCGQIWSP